MLKCSAAGCVDVNVRGIGRIIFPVVLYQLCKFTSWDVFVFYVPYTYSFLLHLLPSVFCWAGDLRAIDVLAGVLAHHRTPSTGTFAGE